MPALYTQSDKGLKERVFPMMFERLSNYFSYNGCSFQVHKSKESTGRVVVWREFHLVNSFTCEASFCGPSQGFYKSFHFNIKMLSDMGGEFCKTLATFSQQDHSYYRQILNELHYDFAMMQTEASTNKNNEELMAVVDGKTRRFNKPKIKEKKSRESDVIAIQGFGADCLKSAGILGISRPAKVKK